MRAQLTTAFILIKMMTDSDVSWFWILGTIGLDIFGWILRESFRYVIKNNRKSDLLSMNTEQKIK